MIKLILLYLKNIKNYGLYISIKILFYEIYNILILKNIKDLSYDDTSTSTYNNSKLQQKYDVPYIPTPFYFLRIIYKYFEINKLDNIVFFDLGCGFCRPAIYLKKKINMNFLGFEINKEIISKLNINKYSNFRIFNLSLRQIKNIQKIINQNLSSTNVNIFFISDTVEIELINEIYQIFTTKNKIILIFVNSKIEKFINNNFELSKKIEFKNKTRNIAFYRNFK